MPENMKQNAPSHPGAETIDLLDLTIIIANSKKHIVGAALLCAVIAAGGSLLMADRYTARAQFLPPQAASGASALLGQFGALGGLAGASLGMKNSTDLYIGILNSRRVSDRLIERFKLQAVYEAKTVTDTRVKLKKVTGISGEKDGLVTVEVTDTDPVRAAALTNAYVEELTAVTNTFAITEASQRRLFFEKQLSQAKDGLVAAEIALKTLQEKTGVIQLGSQAESIIRAASTLKAQIAAKEVAIGALKTFATASHPEYVRAQQEVAGLKEQLVKVETGITNGKGDISIPTSNVPGIGLEYLRSMRDVKYHEAIFELLAKQFEIAKIDEAKEGSSVQVLDKAIVPDKKSKPTRSLIVLLAAMAGGVLAAVWAILAEASARMGGDQVNRARLARLRASLRWTKPVPKG